MSGNTERARIEGSAGPIESSHSGDINTQPLDVLKVTHYEINKALTKVVRKSGVGRERAISVAVLWRDQTAQYADQQLNAGKEITSQQALDRGLQDAIQIYKDRRSLLTSLKSRKKLALLDDLSKEQTRQSQSLQLERRTISQSEAAIQQETFSERFETIPSKKGRSSITMQSRRKEGNVVLPQVAFETTFNQTSKAMSIGVAQRVQGDMHLSAIIFEQYQEAKRNGFTMPPIEKVSFRYVVNADTKEAMRICGPGTFQKDTEQFQLLQKTAFVKAIRYLHNDHSEMFAGSNLTSIDVPSSSKLVCKFN